MVLNIEMSEMAKLMTCVSNYQELANYFTQLTSGEKGDLLRQFWTTKVIKREKNLMLTEKEYFHWNDVNIHVVKQMWGNTSCGWEGIGGDAMSAAYTTVIENDYYGFSCVYYNGQLAYICEMDSKYKKYAQDKYKNLPGCSGCKSVLTVIYSKY